MAGKRWYQDYRIVVALIGLIGTVVTLLIAKGQEKGDVQEKRPAHAESRESPSLAPIPTVQTLDVAVIVVDDITEDRVSGARVLADEQGISKETDGQGRCTLSVRPGLKRLRITVVRDGYQTQNVELSVFEGMDPARVRLHRR